jgi:hypothetical protein
MNLAAAEPQPAWARGLPLPLLRDVAAALTSPHARGAFGKVKERDVAAALLAGQVIVAREGDGSEFMRIGAAAVGHVLRAGSAHRDATGREAHPRAGDLVVSALRGSGSALGRVMARLAWMRAPAAWLEIYQEDEPLRAALPEAYRWALTKVSAAAELKGLYVGGPEASARLAEIPPQPAAERAVLARLEAGEVPVEQLLAEAEGAEAGFAQHYAVYNLRRSWTALALRGFSDDPSFIEKPAEMSRGWKAKHAELLAAPARWTAAAERFPRALGFVAAFLARHGLGGEAQLERVRFMRVAKGGGLARHADITDREAGVADGRVARLHFPLRSSPGCAFLAWTDLGERLERHLAPGEAWYLDQRRPHAVENLGGDARLHLVVDVRSSAALRRLIAGAGA